jgi:hypothetical protein
VAQADLSAVSAVAIDETACRRGHDYLTIAADARERRVGFVTEGRDAATIARFAEHLATHKARPEQITAVSIDMSPAFIRGVADHLPKARITFDKFHVVAHASAALDQTRRRKQRHDPSLKGLCWTLRQGPPPAVRPKSRRRPLRYASTASIAYLHNLHRWRARSSCRLWPCATVDKYQAVRASLVTAPLPALTWCMILLTVLRSYPHKAVRTGLPGQFEHFVAYAGSAAVAMAGYGMSQGSMQVIDGFWVYAGMSEYLHHFSPGRPPAIGVK